MSSEIHPTAVALARALLAVVGMIALAAGIALYFSAVEVTAWQWVLIVSVATLSLLSAYFESSSGVVATMIMLIYPIT